MHHAVLLLISFLANVPVIQEICAVSRILLWRVKQVKDFKFQWKISVKKQPRLRAFPTYVVSETNCSVLSIIRGNVGEGVHGLFRDTYNPERTLDWATNRKYNCNIFIICIIHTKLTIIVRVNRPWFLFAFGIPEQKSKNALFPPSSLVIDNLRLIHTYHAVSLRVWDCVFPIWFTQCGSVWFTHVMPCSCCSESDFSRLRHNMCELTSAVSWRSVSDLPRLGFFWLPRGVAGRLSSESQTEMQMASVKPSNICHGWGEADYFDAWTWVLYNLQHKDYDNNLVNNSIWRPYIVTSSMYIQWCLLKSRSTCCKCQKSCHWHAVPHV